jgi:hypothetical protein
MAPGEHVFSTVPVNASIKLVTECEKASPNLQYCYGDGTSFAAPSVSGEAALLWGNCPTLSASDITNAIEQHTVPVVDDLAQPLPASQQGHGLVQIDGALTAVLSDPRCAH